MDIIDIALAKNFAKKMAAGFTDVEVDGMNIIFTLIDGQTVTLTVPTPADGVSVTDLEIDGNGNLICTMSDGTEINAGKALPQKGVDYFTSEDIANIETDIINVVDDNINEVEAELTMLKSNFDKITITPSNDIMIEDAINNRIENSTLIGKTIQTVYSGKNLFNGNSPNTTSNVTTQFSNNIVTVSSITTSTVPYACWEFNVTKGDIIRINAIVKNSNGRIARQYWNGSSWTGYSEIEYNDGVSVSSLSYTVPDGIELVRFNLYSNNGIPSGNASSQYQDVIVTINKSDMTYEPYVGGTASPNPTYPQTINNVTGNIKTETSNKNLFDISKVKNLAMVTSNNINMIRVNANYRGYYLKVKQGEIYTVSRKNDTAPNRFRCCFTIYEPADGIFTYNQDKSDYVSKVITVPENMNYLFVYLSNSGETITEDMEIQIEKNSAQSSYTTHQGKSVTFPLAENQKLMEGDYLASDGIHHIKKQTTLWDISSLSSTTQGGIPYLYAVYNISDMKPQGSVGKGTFKCDRAVYSGDYSASDRDNKGYVISKNFVVFFAEGTTVTEVNSRFAGAVLEYELDEEIIEQYTSEQQDAWNNLQKLETYKNVTHIYIYSNESNNTTPNIKLTYLQNPLTDINNRLKILEQ